MSACAKFKRPSLSRSGLKVPSGVVRWGGVVADAHFSVQLKQKPS